jgi:hypothetical protein
MLTYEEQNAIAEYKAQREQAFKDLMESSENSVYM